MSIQKSRIRSERVVTQDSFSIAARFYEPKVSVRAAILLVPAMGVGQDYYRAFAAFLATRGYCVATFDYRGIGQSRVGSLRGFSATIFDWARLDTAAMVDALCARAEEKTLYWIGHSLGGQILPFVPNANRFSKVITVATGSGYWRENAPALARKVWWLWYVVVPVALSLCGYFPGKRLRKVGDLPKGVMAQWRAWCLNSEYSLGVEDGAKEQFAAVKTPIHSISFTDDELMSQKNVESIHSFYTQSPRTMKRFAPEDLGATHIGHFGFFRPRFQASLWEKHLLPELR